MRFWRISNHADLSGEGGRLVGGRWHSQGVPIVYAAEHPALALLEVLVHLEIDAADLPTGYQLLEAEAPATISLESVTEDELRTIDGAWREKQAVTRAYGDAWLAQRRSALLRVPSVILPDCANILFNPAHAEAASVRVASVKRATFDSRLFGRP